METQFCKDSIMKKSLTFYTLFAVTNNLFSPCTTTYYTCDILYNIVPDIFCV